MNIRMMAVAAFAASCAFAAGTRHAGNPVYPTYDGRVMAGYQGWFHNRSGGVMYPTEESVRIDMWPDVSEYEKTYPTGLKLANGETARFFCSDDESTVETHFRTGEGAKLLRGERAPTPPGEIPARPSRTERK